MRVTLRTKLIVSYVAAAAFLAVSLMLVSKHYLDRQFQIYVSHMREMKRMEVVDAVSKNFAGSASNPDSEFLSFLGGLSDSLSGQGVVLMVYDTSGGMMFCSDLSENACRHHMVLETNDGKGADCPEFRGTYARERFAVERGGSAIGEVLMGYHTPLGYDEGDAGFLSAYNRIFFIMAALFFALSAVMGLIMAGMIAGPIARVTERTRRIAEGDFSGEFAETGTTEIDELSSSVSQLASGLRTQFMLKKRMASDYSHEFRTPLAVLQSNLEAMVDGLWKPTKERLESLLAEVLRMSRMVSDVDELVRVGNPEAKTEKVQCDLRAMTERILRGFETRAAEKSITLEFSGDECVAPVDPDKFSQVIVNLISNAVKYTDDGGHVRVAVGGSGGEAVVTVEDDGIGIAGSDIPYIFEHLYRTDESRARDSGGNGIGLSVARAVVESHRGSIKVESAPGSGSTFTVRIPA